MRRRTDRRNYYNAPLHIRRNNMHVHISKELKDKKRTRLVKKGDHVRVMVGEYKGKTAEVVSVDYIKRKVFLSGISKRNTRGVEHPIPFDPSNLMLVSAPKKKEEKKKQPSKKKEVSEKKSKKGDQ